MIDANPRRCTHLIAPYTPTGVASDTSTRGGQVASNHSHLMQWLGYLDLTVQISGRYNHALRRLIRTRMVSGEFEP